MRQERMGAELPGLGDFEPAEGDSARATTGTETGRGQDRRTSFFTSLGQIQQEARGQGNRSTGAHRVWAGNKWEGKGRAEGPVESWQCEQAPHCLPEGFTPVIDLCSPVGKLRHRANHPVAERQNLSQISAAGLMAVSAGFSHTLVCPVDRAKAGPVQETHAVPNYPEASCAGPQEKIAPSPRARLPKWIDLRIIEVTEEPGEPGGRCTCHWL